MQKNNSVVVEYNVDTQNYRRMLECYYSKDIQKIGAQYSAITIGVCLIFLIALAWMWASGGENGSQIIFYCIVYFLFLILAVSFKWIKAAVMRAKIGTMEYKDKEEVPVIRVEFSKRCCTVFLGQGSSYVMEYKNCIAREFSDGFFLAFAPIQIFVPADYISNEDILKISELLETGCENSFIRYEKAVCKGTPLSAIYPEGHFGLKPQIASSCVQFKEDDPNLIAESYIYKVALFSIVTSLICSAFISAIAAFAASDVGLEKDNIALISSLVFGAFFALCLLPILKRRFQIFSESQKIAHSGTELILFEDKFIYNDFAYYLCEIKKVKRYKGVYVLFLANSELRLPWVFLPAEAVEDRKVLDMLINNVNNKK